MASHYIETVTSIRTCILKGYLEYEPNDLTASSFDQGTGYRVVQLQGTFCIFKS